MPHRLAAASLVFALCAAAAAAQTPISEAEVRALAIRQAAALNAGDLPAYFATFAPQARFAQQALGSNNRIVPYGESTREQARAQLSKALEGAKIAETVEVRQVALSADGRGAAMAARVRTRIERGSARLSCADRLATFVRIRGELKTLAQTDTLVRCRTAP
ncbi:nuclear transport factor 2 family protein [Phenylobacterium sp.]|uniref:nuclear transport factor 2 family protein n=1 Tax=Phenylobacterium sp. TaxID=1871053 RepID=UPI002812485E|nr:nuclear transport factor 2 family protein [Phenylobacterium sp.]